jgi:hypothetical protein
MPASSSVLADAFTQLRSQGMTWAVAALLPLPALLADDPATNADAACVYLGVACAWLSGEILRAGDIPATRQLWLTKILATSLAVGANVALFILLGVSAGVQSNIPLPLLAILSAIPAIGLIPWLTLRIKNRYAALLAAALLVLACKLAGCIVARLVYGPHFMQQGYVDGDWRNAKLMISLFWSLTTGISLALLLAGTLAFTPQRQPERA